MIVNESCCWFCQSQWQVLGRIGYEKPSWTRNCLINGSPRPTNPQAMNANQRCKIKHQHSISASVIGFSSNDFFSEKIILGPREVQISWFLVLWSLTHYILRLVFFRDQPTPPICLKMPKFVKCIFFAEFRCCSALWCSARYPSALWSLWLGLRLRLPTVGFSLLSGPRILSPTPVSFNQI